MTEPLYDAGVVERAAAELDSGGQGGDRLGDAVRNLAKLLDKTAGKLEQAKRLSFKNGFEAARLAPFERQVRGWKRRAAELGAQVGVVRALHQRVSDDSGHYCGSCLNGWGEPMRWPCPTTRAMDAGLDIAAPTTSVSAPPAELSPPEALGAVWRGWALGIQDWAEESLREDPTPADRWDLGWNAALKSVCISIVQATLGDFPYQVDPDCECEGRCPMCARWGCEQCCDGEMPADHGVKEGIVVRVPEGP